ncbi:hypothetical protein NMG60_11004659 [Bertholletia excelsa]
MEAAKADRKKNLLIKTWNRCLSFSGSRQKSPSPKPSKTLSKSKSWPFNSSKSCQVAPEGCFSVYVGPERRRFVIKARQANHPLFRMLLEDAEMEYGFSSNGPLLIPCEVDLFCKVLAEMERKKDVPGCGFVYGQFSPFNPARRLGNGAMAQEVGPYGLLTQPRLLKMNQV